jgi:acetyl esterase/lipase
MNKIHLFAGLLIFFVTVSSNAQEATVVDSSTEAAKASPKIYADVVYGHKMGMALTLDVVQPSEPNGAAVIFVVSGGWNSNWFPPESYQRIEMLNDLVDKGYVVILLRHGSAPLFKVPDAVADVKKAVRFLHERCGEFRFEANRIGVCGMSAGGHLSLMLGTDTNQKQSKDDTEEMAPSTNSARVAAVVAYFPPTDLRTMVGPSRDFPALDFDQEKGKDVSPLLHVTPDDAPTLLVHGTKDRLVPLKHSEQIKTAFDDSKVPCELITIEGAGHGFRGDDSKRATQSSIEWFDRYLNPPKDN